ncbi:SEC-C metal-binding domain-containing protein [Pseudomonas sp. RC2C2]|uniref:SEC-C metal-binding domain-containing protein n=1 Tax=Pseudomonas sp. RC2C2 TaxID=2834408 RepID=UPI001BCB2225|nr:SEC-C metal-binding domain-containing protein [Pseudomonas sp. RC2C2]MBS7596933.1 SEC-C domain-containing protein [Pseudomonas sp. RC2C2]
MLKPLVKEPSVNESERILAKVAAKTFFSLWSYPSLFRSVGKGKELIDLTVYFNNTLILFSDKGEVKLQEHTDPILAWSRWYRSAIKDSAKQLHAAEKFVRNYPRQIFLNSKLVDPFPFDISSPDLKIHLVAVTRGVGEKAKKHFDNIQAGSSGTLAYAYTLPEQKLLEYPFFIGDVDQAKTFVHVLDEYGIALLLEELCTPSDFINYLEAKERAVRKRGLTISPGEEETLAYYLLEDGGRGFGDIKSPAIANGHPFAIPEGQWLEYKKSVPYALRYSRRKHAEAWSQLVASFSDCIVDATVGEGADLPLLNHARAVEVLASENVYSSGLLAQAFFGKYGTVPEMARSSRVIPSQLRPGRLYVFVFFPWDEDYKNYEEYREERRECMFMYALVARYKYQLATEIVILGSATKGDTPGSETIMVIDNSVPLSSDERSIAQKVMKEGSILSDVTERRVKIGGSPTIGRNDFCPCGSGKKYKKCCYKSGYE